LPSASSRFRLATDTLAVRLTLPLAGCVEDFHLQVSAPCRAHHKKGRTAIVRLDRLEAAETGVRTNRNSGHTLVGHDHGIDNVDHTIGLEDIRDGHECSAALFIF